MCSKTHLVGTTWRDGVSQPSLPSREGRRAGVASGAGSAGELPASALTLTEMPSPLTCLGLQRLERRSSSVERRGRHLDIMEGACRQGGSVVPAAAVAHLVRHEPTLIWAKCQASWEPLTTMFNAGAELLVRCKDEAVAIPTPLCHRP